MSNLSKDQKDIDEQEILQRAKTLLVYREWKRASVFKDYWGSLLKVKPEVLTQQSFGFFNPKRRK